MKDRIKITLTRESQDAMQYLRSLGDTDSEIINQALMVLYEMHMIERRVQAQVLNDGMTVH